MGISIGTTGSGYFSKITQSIAYFLNNVVYSKDGTLTTLPTQYNNLNVVIGFPDSLEQLNSPTLAIMKGITTSQIETYTNGIKEIPVNFTIYGFAGGGLTDGANIFQRDELCNDIREILEDSDYIDLFNYPTFPDKFTYTGKSVVSGIGIAYTYNLTGIPSNGTNAVSSHTSGSSLSYYNMGTVVNLNVTANDTSINIPGDNNDGEITTIERSAQSLPSSGTAYIYDSNTIVGNIVIESVESRDIEPTGHTDADKYRFAIDLECSYIKD